VKKLFVVAVAAALLSSPQARAEDAKPAVVGVILQGGPWYAVVEGLKGALEQLHRHEAKPFRLDIRDTRGDLKAVEEAARSLEREKVALIVTVATSVSLAAKQATASTPIVFCAGTDPVGVGLVETIPKPGGRMTGVHFFSTDLTGKRLELLKEMIPHLSSVVTFYNPANRSALASAKEGREAAPRLGLAFLERLVSSPEELRAALDAFRPGEAGAYVAVSDAMVDTQAQLIIDMARAKKLPTMFYEEGLTASGGLTSYSADFHEVGRMAAKYVHRILAGASPRDLPVEQAARFAFVINLKTAKEINLPISEALLARADRVID
jgi:putative tryptophan/tyrosine transport system substrate-binding protein